MVTFATGKLPPSSSLLPIQQKNGGPDSAVGTPFTNYTPSNADSPVDACPQQAPFTNSSSPSEAVGPVDVSNSSRFVE
ncbi:hypothetical protein KFK09_011326 [Dendrobium nobile]|uniref:Uncharacterized protein n=1 Tax=Dendrobium nobile TaxID=94219 RepID=A0A8T3BEL4_DENNO|nr:hypothetical protein KFK09_011326 [Dendrobium nobile]